MVFDDFFQHLLGCSVGHRALPGRGPRCHLELDCRVRALEWSLWCQITQGGASDGDQVCWPHKLGLVHVGFS